MRRIIMLLAVLALVVTMLVAMALPGFASNFENEANCGQNVGKQADPLDQNGAEIGTETGSLEDEKRAPAPVTNCDQYWQVFGSNPDHL